MPPRQRDKLPVRQSCKRALCRYFLTLTGFCLNPTCFYASHPQSETEDQ